MFISDAFAQGTETVAAQGSPAGAFIQIGAIILIFYLLLLRPQQKRIKQHEDMLGTIKKGDRIITGGGIFAKVLDASDPIELTAEIADGVVVKIHRGTVRELLTDEALASQAKAGLKKSSASKAANSNKKNKKQ